MKPSNVMLQSAVGQIDNSSHTTILTDFGIAKILTSDTGATSTGTMMGTLDYMAPEQIRVSREVDGRADVYALGVMLYRMLTGELPFKGDHPSAIMLGHLHELPPDPRTLVPGLPETVATAILRALAKDPDERYPMAGELAEAVE